MSIWIELFKYQYKILPIVTVKIELAYPSKLQLSLKWPPLPDATTNILPYPLLPAITPCAKAAYKNEKSSEYRIGR